MKSIPSTAIQGCTTILRPYRPALNEVKLMSFLDSLVEKPILVSDLMTITGKCKTAVKNRLRDAGVQPVGVGGKTGKENTYDRSEALKALEVI